MASTTFNSDQVTKWEATPNEKVRANELSGELRVARFSFDNTGGTSANSGDTVELTRLPEGARIVTGVLEVTTTFAANANFNIGDGSSAARFNSSVINIDAAGETEFAKLANEDGNLATELSAETPIVATFDTAGGNGAFEGYILYVDV